jgi:lysyl-tRNA synthetase class I
LDATSPYAVHMENMLLEALEKAGVETKLYRGYEMYGRGVLKEQITAILTQWRAIGEKIEEMTGQSKFKKSLALFSVVRIMRTDIHHPCPLLRT